MDFAQIIISWYQKNKRDLPWRKTRDPYRVWLSEVILQQTRVAQGTAYYISFEKKYSSIKKLAEAPEKDILKLWQGLGYYSRARNLHHAAKEVVKNYGGRFPDNYEEIKKLKGIGEYTAAAISSFCFNEVQPVVDGNVYRVLSRIFGIETAIDSSQGKKEFRELAAELISKKNPADFNQAIMEFGALQCVPKNPVCVNCPFVQFCIARKKNLIAELPFKSKKINVRDRYFYYLVIRNKGNLYLKQRTEKDIWKNLYDFPLIETENKISEKKLIVSNEWKSLFGNSKLKIIDISDEVKHVLSHQRLHVWFVEIKIAGKLEIHHPDSLWANRPSSGRRVVEKMKNKKNWISVKEEDLEKYAVPVLIDDYLKREGGRKTGDGGRGTRDAGRGK